MELSLVTHSDGCFFICSMEQAATLEKQDASNEYVVGNRSGYAEPSVERVDTVDHHDHRLDQELIERLRVDSEVESNIGILADSIFSDGLEVVSAVADEDDAEFAEAQEIADFVRKAIEMPRPLKQIAREMFKGAFYNGVKVAEIVLKYRKDGRVDGKLVLDRVNPKPNSATAFVTDRFYNVIGLVGARRAGEIAAPSGHISLNSDEIIPREKFFILSIEQEDNDPRCLSQVRALVQDYCDKQVTRAQWREWRRTSAIPKKVGITASGQKDAELKNPDGSPVVENGVRKTVSAQVAMTKALDSFENNSSIGIPNGADVKQLEVNGTGLQFERHAKSCNLAMRKLILGDSLATGEADKDARAARESSKDVIDIRKQNFRTIIADAIERDIFRLLTSVNFGDDKTHLTPKCFLGDTEANDWATDVQAAARAGYKFTDRQMRQLDTQFGLEPREENETVETEVPPTGIEDPETEPTANVDEEEQETK